MAGTFDTPRAQVEAIAAAHADAVEAFYANYVDAIEARDRAILQIVDAGWPKRFAARCFRISEGRVTQIIAARAAVPLASSS